MTGPLAALERLRVGLADRGITVPDGDDPDTATITAALDAIDQLRRPLANRVGPLNPCHIVFSPSPPPPPVIVPVPFDPRTGRMLA
ncbi:hypothetical protein ABZ671_18920 [Micromonospora sp. NPDC006766]|uniref:hypothetical protein n=1 Tax=Micromonospora sp. NPDC006766 TaxID=3154778 RepID=UPI00340302D1